VCNRFLSMRHLVSSTTMITTNIRKIDLKTLVDSSHDVLCAIKNNVFVYVSPSCFSQWEYTPDELIGRNVLDCVAETDRLETSEAIARISKSKSSCHFKNKCIKKSGSIVHVSWVAKWGKGEKLIYLVAKNVVLVNEYKKELKKAKQFASDCSMQLDEVLENLGDVFFVVDRNWKIRFFNKKAEQLMHSGREKVLGKDVRTIYPGNQYSHVIAKYGEAFKTNKPVEFEFFSQTAQCWFQAFVYPSHNGISVNFKNISELKKKEEEVRIAKERFEFVSRATSDVIWDLDVRDNSIYISPAFATIFGYDPKQGFDTQSWFANIYHDDKARMNKIQQKIFNDASVNNVNASYRFKRADGTIAFVENKGIVIRNAAGKVMRLVGAMRDITKQKKIETELKLSEQRYRHLFYDSPRPKWMFDADSYRFLEVNNATIEHYGFSKEEFLQMTIFDIRPQEEIESIRKIAKRLKTDKNFKHHGFSRHLKKNGDVITVEVNSHAIVIEGKMHIVVSAIDVTEKLMTEKRITTAIINAQEEERSFIGKELHDNVCQLLATAKLYAESTKYDPEQRESFTAKSIDIIQTCIDEIRSLSKALVAPDLMELGFRDSIKELISHYKALQIFDVEFSYTVKNKELDRTLQLTLYRIMQELFNNTIKYAKATKVQLTLEEKNNKLRLNYKDNGVGFDLNQKKSGIGIKNIKSRVDAFKGHLHLVTGPGEGTEFIIEVSY
jgi:PAS domain S-box-containing protein